MSLAQPTLFHGSAGNAYGAFKLRRMMASLVCDQEGVLGGDHLLCTPDSPASMRVKIAAGRAFIVNDTSSTRGVYLVDNTAPDVSPYATPAHATLPRIDLVVLQIHDIASDGGGTGPPDVDTFEIIAGTPAASPVAPAVPATTTLPLAEILIPAAATAISTITDRRPFAAFLAPGANLLGNQRFTSWSRGTSSPPDAYSVTSGTVAQDLTNLDDTAKYAAALTNTVSTQADLSQKWGANTTDVVLTQVKGRALTMVARVRASAASRVVLFIYDGVTTTQSSPHSGSGLYETLQITANIDKAATGAVTCGLRILTGTAITAQIASAGLYLGSTLRTDQPTNTAFYHSLIPTIRQGALDELYTCRVHEHGVGTWAGWSSAASMAVKTPIQYHNRKAANATITFSGTTYTNGATVAATDSSLDGFSLGFTTSSSGAAANMFTQWDAVV